MPVSVSNRKVLFSVVTFLAVAALVEFAASAAVRFLQSKGHVYRPPVASEGNSMTFEEYLAIRDDELGWPSAQRFGDHHYDEEGGRRNPDYPHLQQSPACVFTFGDSYMAGLEVEHEDAWTVLLSRSLGCRVANFGVGGYGSDQAYLRYKKKAKDAPRVVMLGHLPENIFRNTMRCRDLYTGVRNYGLKPRFVIDESGDLQLIPIPSLTANEYERMVGLASPPLVLDHEYFYPGGPANTYLVRPPFSWSLIRSLGHFRLKARLLGRRAEHDFYSPDHPAGGLQVTAGIFRNFVRDVRQAGGQPLIILFAGPHEVYALNESGVSAYQPLLDIMDGEGMPYVDMAAALQAYLGKRDAIELIVRGHYNEEGNRQVAHVVEEFMRGNGLIDHLDVPRRADELTPPADG